MSAATSRSSFAAERNTARSSEGAMPRCARTLPIA